jgi:hypothetical protein
MAEESDYSLLLAFDSDDEEFVRGFEAGRLCEQLRGEDEVHQMIHAANAEMAMRMCEKEHREFSAEHVDDEWIDLRVEPRGWEDR